MNYAEKLKHPKWQRKRLEVLERDNWTCQECRNTEITLHVHHKSYRGYDPWAVKIEELVTLCDDCHKSVHKVKQSVRVEAEHTEEYIRAFDVFFCEAYIVATQQIDCLNTEKNCVGFLSFDDVLSEVSCDKISVREYYKWIKDAELPEPCCTAPPPKHTPECLNNIDDWDPKNDDSFDSIPF